MGREDDHIDPHMFTHRPGQSSSAPPPAYHEQRNEDSKPKDADAKIGSLTENDTDDIDSITSVNSTLPPPSIHDEIAESIQGPNVDHPFAFPAEPPSYPGPPTDPSLPSDTKHPPPAAPTTTTTTKLIAIPQQLPTPESPFLPAYPPALLPYGIPSATFLSFLTTLSTFLNATVSDAAIAHATTIARTTAIEIPRSLGRGIAHDTTQGVKHIGRSLKRGNVFGVIGTVIGYSFGLTGRLIGSVFMVPASLVQRPQTARERADVYVEVTNRKWWNPRGLHGRLMSSAEIAGVLDVRVDEFVERAGKGGAAKDAQGVVDGLGEWFEGLTVEEETGVEVDGKGKGRTETMELTIGRQSLWLVIVQGEVAAEAMRQTKRARKEQKRARREQKRRERHRN